MAPDITSPANERIKWLVRLRERRHREAENVFVVEGARLYARALEAGLVPLVTFVTEGVGADLAGEVWTVDPPALDRASYRQRSEGLIAVFPDFPRSLGTVDVAATPLLLVAESIEKPGNLGAMLRTAGAAGVDALITVGRGVDASSPNTIRASTGAFFTVPLAITDWGELTPWLTERGISVVAATPTGSRSLWGADLTGPLAIVVGAEDRGLGETALALADETVHIPQTPGPVDSLNVSVAAAVLLFEARRQRGSA
jgi:RNA methyltransferase, TrmH family